MKGKISIILASAFGIIQGFSLVSFSQTCLTLPNNLRVGGLVVSQNYLALAGGNSVIVYRRNPQGRWVESHKIDPPPNSTAARSGSGFGASMALDGNNLIIGAFFSRFQSTPADRSDYPFMQPNSNAAYGGAIYRTDVRKPAPVERIDQPKDGEVVGFNVAAHQGNVVFPVNYYDSRGVFSSYTTLVSGKTNRSINIPSGTVAIRNNILVVGNTSFLGGNGPHNVGLLSIFDLKQPKQSPRKIETNFPVLSISVSDQLIAVSGSSHVRYSAENQRKALIIRIKDGTEHILKGSGMIYAHRNLIVRSYPYTPDYETPGQIELFDFQDINKPRLMYARRQVDAQAARVNDQELFVVQNSKPCIEPLPK
jgi:hypothetical protein